MTTKNPQEVQEALAQAREEELYHESARELAARIVELESRVEGLESQLHDTEGDAIQLSQDMEKLEIRGAELADEVDQHKVRYAGAIKMIERRQEQLQLQRKAYVVLARQFTERGERYGKLTQTIAELTGSLRDLRHVPQSELDQAISVLANAFDTALLS